MKAINLNCSNEDSFKYSILISLYYYHFKEHKERTNKLNKYTNDHNFTSINFNEFENNNPNISLCIYDDFGKLIHNSNNNSTNKEYIIKINNRYHALKPTKDKYTKLNNLLKQFTQKELSDFILKKTIM